MGRAGIEKEFGVKAIYSPADMTKPAEIAEMIAATEKTIGRCDVLVNNAGMSPLYPSLDAVPHAFAGDHRLPDYVKGVVTL